jgi:hypothetical protein
MPGELSEKRGEGLSEMDIDNGRRELIIVPRLMKDREPLAQK